MKKLLMILGIVFIIFIVFVFAIALQIYNETPEREEQKQITINQETQKPLTKLESAERQSVQDWKDEIEARKKEVGR